MKVLFIHDHIFKKSADQHYSSGGLPASIWPRYTSVFEHVTVVGRDGGLLTEKDKGYTSSNAENVTFNLLPSLTNLKSLLLGNKKVEQAAKELVGNHDGVIARLPSRLGHLFVREAIKQNKPYAIEVVGCPWDALWNYGSWKGKLLAPFAALNLKRAAKKAPFAIYVTEHFLQGRYPNSFGLAVGCSDVVIASTDSYVLDKRINKIDNISEGDTITFGLIANYSSKYKGIDIAIKALKAASLPNWQFRVLGSGDASHYKKLAQGLGVADKVHFVGSLPSGGAVFDWVDSIDIYLHPSFTEGLPRALAEAMSRGAPALASNIAGIPELLEKAELIQAGDYKELANKIKILIKDKDLQKKLARQNFEKAKSYNKELLDTRRTNFWHEFKQYIESHK